MAVPSPSTLSAQIFPLWSSIIFLTMASPIPLLPCLLFLDDLFVKHRYFFIKLNRVILLFDLFLYDRIYDSDSRQVQDVTRRTFHVGEVDRFVQTHLDRADPFR